MFRSYCIILTLLIPVTVCSQTDDVRAREYYNNGNYLVHVKNYKGAIAEYTKAISRDTDFIQAYENRGVAKYYLMDYEGAIDDYNKALEINPKDYNTYGRRGHAKFRMEDLTGAIDDFNKALEGGRNDADYYNTMGQAKYYLLDYNGAIADFNRVIRFWSGTREQRSIAFYWRGISKIDMGRKEDGCPDLGKAAELGHNQAFAVIEIFCR